MTRISYGRCALAVTAAMLAACTSDTTGSTDTGQLAIVNALMIGSDAHLSLDNSLATLPPVWGSSTMMVAAGTHQLTVTAGDGQPLANATFSIAAGGRRTAVLTGSTTTNAALSITSDTMSTTPGGGYHSIVGSVLMVNSAPGVGPFSIVVHQVGSDSVYHFGGFGYGAGSLPPPSPYGFAIPFVPATYIIDITNPGSETPLATTQLTLATNDRWIVILTTSIEGDLVLQVSKQQ